MSLVNFTSKRKLDRSWSVPKKPSSHAEIIHISEEPRLRQYGQYYILQVYVYPHLDHYYYEAICNSHLLWNFYKLPKASCCYLLEQILAFDAHCMVMFLTYYMKAVQTSHVLIVARSTGTSVWSSISGNLWEGISLPQIQTTQLI